MWIHWPFFPKTWTKGHWPLDDLWPHVCWGHMCDSTQGSLCPSPMTIHQCMWIQWSILQNTTYIHTHTTCRMSDHIVSYWTQFRRDKNEYFAPIRLCSFDFKKLCTLSFLTFTYVHSYAGDFICVTAFHERDVRDAGDFIWLAGEGETVYRQETPSQCRRVDNPVENA